MRAVLLHAAVCLALLPCRAHGAPAAAPQVEVQTADGRVLGGVLDARTDDERLWVRQDSGPIALAASVAWNDVAAATVAGEAMSSEQLRTRRGELATEATAPALPPRLTAPLVAATPWTPRRRTTVRNLEIVDAYVVNLDRDVEPDGITVSIVAVGDDGRPVAVRGSLSASLFGERRPNDVPLVDFPELDRWSQPVRPADFVDGVATYELLFRGTAPEWQFDLLPDAVLDVRLGAFGHGNFAAATPLVIRPLNPTRDDLQLRRGTRFFPRELHGRFPSSAPATRDGRWIHWTW